MGYISKARTHYEKVAEVLRTTANTKGFERNRAVIRDKVISRLVNDECVSDDGLRRSLHELQISESIFLRFFADIKDLDKEVQKKGWEALLYKLRRAVIGCTGPEVLFRMAKCYGEYARENRTIFEYAVCSGRYTVIGQRYLKQLVYLIKIVLLSNGHEREEVTTIAKNFSEVMHGVTVLELDKYKDDADSGLKPNHELLEEYVYSIFDVNPIFRDRSAF